MEFKPFIVKQWYDYKEYDIHVFVGSNNLLSIDKEKKIIEEKYIGYRKIIIHHYYINRDDSINIVLKKLCIHLYNEDTSLIESDEDIYMWSWRIISNIECEINNFVYNITRKGSIKIEPLKLREYIKKYFDYDVNEGLPKSYIYMDRMDIYNMMIKLKNLKKVIEPINYRFYNNGYLSIIEYNPIEDNNKDKNLGNIKKNTSLIISSFLNDENEINVITYNDFSKCDLNLNKYFYYHNDNDSYNPSKRDSIQEFIKRIDEIEKRLNLYNFVGNKEETTVKVNHIHYKFNNLSFNEKVNLELLFERLHCNKDIVFIKLKLIHNTYFKILKTFLPQISDYKKKWIDGDYKASFSQITIVIKYGKIFCDMFINEDLSYDIIFRLNKDTLFGKFILTDYYDKFNRVINIINKTFNASNVPYLDDNHNLTINQLNTYNIIHKVNVNYSECEYLLESMMKPFFNIILSDKNHINLEYKKVNNFETVDKIKFYIKKNKAKSNSLIINGIINEFGYDEDSAKEIYYLHQSDNTDIDAKNKYYNKFYYKNKNNVTVKIKKSETSEFSYSVNGLRSLNTCSNAQLLYDHICGINDNIMKIMKIMINLSSNKKLLKQISKFENYDMMAHEDYDNKKYNNYNDSNDDNNDDSDDDSIDLFKLAQQFEDNEIPNNEDLDNNNKNINTGKGKGKLLDKLKRADPDLFFKGYSTLCQASDKKQPVVVNEKKQKELGLEYVKSGSTPELARKNFYICPEVWCPISETAYKLDYFNNEMEGKCPNKEDPIFTCGHPGFYSKHKAHPQGLCMPCCFRRKQSKKLYCKTNDPTQDTCSIKNEIEDKINSSKYILKDDEFPLQKSRYGFLLKKFNTIIDNNDTNKLISESTRCFLRKGIQQNELNSFLTCITSVLNNNEVDNPEKFIKKINDTLSVTTYLMLENGKICKYFINKELDIHNKNHFNDFKNWFLHDDRKSYWIQFRLLGICEDLKNFSIEDDFFNILRLKNNFKIIIREFIIYNSFTSFLKYINTKNCLDYRIFIDLINIDFHLNPNKYNIIVLEYNNDKNFNLICPPNRDPRSYFNLNNGFVFIVTNNIFYEPIIYQEGINKTVTNYKYNDYENIRPLLNILINDNNNKKDDTLRNNDILNFINNHVGNKEINLNWHIKCYVINYDYMIKGIITKKNLYIPFINKIELFDIQDSQYIYYDQIIREKCLLNENEIIKIFKELQDYTKNDFYQIKHIIREFKGKKKMITSIILNYDTVIPINMSNIYNFKVKSICQDLEIFIEYERYDFRKKIIKDTENKTSDINKILNELQYNISKDLSLKTELDFIRDRYNPLPKNFKRKKILELLNKINIGPKFLINKWKFSIIEDILNNIPIISFNKKALYSITDDEILFDAHDVMGSNNNLDKAIEYQCDPYRVINEQINSITDSYVSTDNKKAFNSENLHTFLFKNYNYKLIKIRDNNKSISFKNFELVQIKIEEYEPNFIYNLFNNINQYIYPKKIIMQDLKNIIYKRIINDYETGNMDKLYKEFSRNMSYNNITKQYSKSPTVTELDNIIRSPYYYPGYYEFETLSKYINVNIIIIGRKSKYTNMFPSTDGVCVIKSHSPYYVILNYKNIKNKYQKFDVIVKNNENVKDKYKIIFTIEDFSNLIQNRIKLDKCILYLYDYQELNDNIKFEEDVSLCSESTDEFSDYKSSYSSDNEIENYSDPYSKNLNIPKHNILTSNFNNSCYYSSIAQFLRRIPQILNFKKLNNSHNSKIINAILILIQSLNKKSDTTIIIDHDDKLVNNTTYESNFAIIQQLYQTKYAMQDPTDILSAFADHPEFANLTNIEHHEIRTCVDNKKPYFNERKNISILLLYGWSNNLSELYNNNIKKTSYLNIFECDPQYKEKSKNEPTKVNKEEYYSGKTLCENYYHPYSQYLILKIINRAVRINNTIKVNTDYLLINTSLNVFSNSSSSSYKIKGCLLAFPLHFTFAECILQDDNSLIWFNFDDTQKKIIIIPKSTIDKHCFIVLYEKQ